MTKKENNLGVVILEKEEETKRREERKIHISPTSSGIQTELLAAFEYLIFPTETKPPEAKDPSRAPWFLSHGVVG